MKVNNINTMLFQGALDEPLTRSLALLNTNPMLNASAVDVFAMGLPRTVVEYRERNKYAGAEMAFREFTGTFIACFSAGLFGQMINKAASKRVNPEIKVNSASWASNNTIDVLNSIWEKSPDNYTENFFNSIQEFRDSSDSAAKDEIKQTFEKLINNKNITEKELKKILKNLSEKVINLTGVESRLTVDSGKNSVTSSVQNVLRDAADLGKNVFAGENVQDSLAKLKKLNKIKTYGALAMSVALALTNQALNRYITKKRTGSSEFVGNMSYESGEKTDNKKNLNLNKFIASAGFVLMLAKVMGVKSFKDFFTKLEFNGPTTSGNAIKTVFGGLVLGRLLASSDNTELRETVVRDYLGFLNWLVLGGFVAKGAGKLMDKNKTELFDKSKKELKTHAEIFAKGGANMKSNLRKLNIAHIAGLAYSTLMLGVFLPKLNIAMTKHKQTKE